MRISVFFILFLLVTDAAFTQDILSDVTDFFEFELGHPPEDSTHYHTKLVLAPVIAYEPSTSLEFGIGSKLLFKFKNSTPETRTSNLPVSVTYTLRKQFIIATEYTFFTNNEKYLIKGASRFLKYPFNYFGTGNLTRDNDKLAVDLNNFLFEPLVLKQLGKQVFLGGGIRYNSVWKAELEKEKDENEINNAIVDSLNTLSSGVELAITLDSRDNVLNAHHGHFVEFTHGFYGKALGGKNKFGITKLNARTYYQLKKHKLDVIAFEFYSRFTWDNVPLFELSSLGGKELLRGYQERRFNDRHALFFQSEYRWQAFTRLGFVFFTGAGDVFSNAHDLSIKNLKYSLGTGIRIKIVKSENLNIRIDYAFGLGPSHDNNFYLGIAEAF